VAELNVYLAPNDMWAAALVPDGAGVRLIARDRTCTDPPVPAEGLAFSNASFASGDDTAGTGLERTQEGHFEVIEMALLPRTLPINPSNPAQNCSAVQGTPDLGSLGAPVGALAGSATLINVASGLDASYVPDVLSSLTSVPFFTLPGQPGSDFDSPQVNAVSHVTSRDFTYRLVWDRPVDAVSSVLASRFFENEFVLDATTASKTDWVLAFPTRRLHVTNTTVTRPFAMPFLPAASVVPCEGLTVEAFDREGVNRAGGVDFPERPPSLTRLCWSAGVFRFEGNISILPVVPTSVLGSTNTLGFTSAFAPINIVPPPGGINTPPGVANGRARLSFDGLGVLTSRPESTRTDLRTGATVTASHQVLGYPGVGFMIRTFTNGTLSCGSSVCQGNYASAFPHRRLAAVVPAN
jgi:hypothetical protein